MSQFGSDEGPLPQKIKVYLQLICPNELALCAVDMRSPCSTLKLVVVVRGVNSCNANVCFGEAYI